MVALFSDRVDRVVIEITFRLQVSLPFMRYGLHGRSVLIGEVPLIVALMQPKINYVGIGAVGCDPGQATEEQPQ
jgi:hypothetical protein